MAWHLSYVWAVRISAGRINGGVADIDMIALDVDCIATELCIRCIALDWETSVRAGYKFELNCILWVASRSTFAMVWKIGFFGLSGYYVDCIGCGLHWIESFLFLLNCNGSRSRIKSRHMDIDWIAIELDWIGLEIRRGSLGGIRSRAETRISQMSTTAWRQFFLKVFKSYASKASMCHRKFWTGVYKKTKDFYKEPKSEKNKKYHPQKINAW